MLKESNVAYLKAFTTNDETRLVKVIFLVIKSNKIWGNCLGLLTLAHGGGDKKVSKMYVI